MFLHFCLIFKFHNKNPQIILLYRVKDFMGKSKYIKHVAQFALERFDERIKVSDLHVLGSLLDPSIMKVPIVEEFVTDYLDQRNVTPEAFINKKLEHFELDDQNESSSTAESVLEPAKVIWQYENKFFIQ